MINRIYDKLFSHYGHQHWWPADTQDEMIIGAVLTQNTNWSNVEKALKNLKDQGFCFLDKIQNIDLDALINCIKPAGYFNQKAKKLKILAKFLKEEDLSLLNDTESREKLLSVWGIGPETADSILLYGFQKPFFVIDTYTIRLLNRLFKGISFQDYHQTQDWICSQIDKNVALYNEFHALIVKNAKISCKKIPICLKCPLIDLCDFAKENQ